MKKRGWIRIVEAFVAVLLIAGVLLILINKGYFGKDDLSEKIYDVENSILREIELDEGLRQEIINVDIDANPVTPTNVLNKINDRKPDYIECNSKICAMNNICELDNYPEVDVYSQSVSISATLQEYKPRQLKLFCWVI